MKKVDFFKNNRYTTVNRPATPMAYAMRISGGYFFYKGVFREI